MIPANYLRQHLDQVQAHVKKRGIDLDFDVYQSLESKRKQLQIETEQAQAESNTLSKQVAIYKREGKDAAEVLQRLARLAKQKKQLETELRKLKAELDDFLLSIPNLLSELVPEGSGEEDNVIVETFGDVPAFDFAIKSHTDLFTDSIDFESAAKISGSRFVMLKGGVARLNRALGQWMLDSQVERGYTEVNPPLLVESKALIGTGQLPKFAEDQFFIQSETHALIPTAEVPLTNLCREKILELEQLPIKYTALTYCFRSEAGAYGKDTAGMIRQHQFEKVELVQLVAAEQALDAFE